MSSLIPNDETKRRSLIEKPQETGSRDSRKEKTSDKLAILRFAVSLAVAGVADSLNVAFPVLFLPVGILTALILLALWGLRWEVAVAVIPELIPGVAMFPSWVLLVCYLAGVKPKTQKKEIQKSDKKSDNW